MSKQTDFDVYEIIKQRDILEFANKLEELLDFADGLSESKLKKIYLEKFYSAVGMFSYTAICSEGEKKYTILTDDKAVLEYVNVTLPEYTSPVKTIKAWRSYVDELRDTFVDPSGEVLRSSDICNIMDYLVKKYNFDKLVNPDMRPVFSILNNTNIYKNNECAGIKMVKGTRNEYFLYNLNEKALAVDLQVRKNPIAIFFHELGHSLYYAYEKEEGVFPKEILDYLKELAPDLADCTYEEQCEVIADTLAMGMMKNSPFEEYDIFPFHPKMKESFSKLVDIIIAGISK